MATTKRGPRYETTLIVATQGESAPEAPEAAAPLAVAVAHLAAQYEDWSTHRSDAVGHRRESELEGNLFSGVAARLRAALAESRRREPVSGDPANWTVGQIAAAVERGEAKVLYRKTEKKAK